MPSVHAIRTFKGLDTDTPPVTAEPGTMTTARNVALSVPGTIKPRENYARLVNDHVEGDVMAIHPFDGGYLLLSPDEAIFDDDTMNGNSTKVRYPDTFETPEIAGPGAAAKNAGNLYFPTTRGLLKVDGAGTSYTLADWAAVNGVVGAQVVSMNEDGLTAESNWLPNGYYVAYTAVVRRGEVRSVPSPPLIYYNDSGVAGYTTVRISWPHATRSPVVGDVVEVYRTIAASAVETLPITYRLAQTHVVSGTGASVDVADKARTQDLGAILYAEVGTEYQPGYQTPPAARFVANFAGSTFLGYLEEKQYLPLTVEFWTGPATNSQVGFHQETASTVSGSPTIPVSSGHGFEAGMELFHGNLPGGRATIVSVTDTSVTVDANASASGSYPMYAYDRMWITVDGSTTFVATAAGCTGMQYFGQGANDYFRFVDLTGVPYGFVYDMPNTNPRTYRGLGVRRFAFEALHSGTSLSIRATNGHLYDPPLPGFNDTPLDFEGKSQPAQLIWSETNQPEHFIPGLWSRFVGESRTPILGLVSVKGALSVFKEDGLFRITGANRRAGFREDKVSTHRLVAQGACCALEEYTVGWVQEGICLFGSDGLELNLTHNRINALLRPYLTDSAPGCSMAWDAKERALRVCLRDSSGNTLALVWHKTTDAWTTVDFLDQAPNTVSADGRAYWTQGDLGLWTPGEAEVSADVVSVTGVTPLGGPDYRIFASVTSAVSGMAAGDVVSRMVSGTYRGGLITTVYTNNGTDAIFDIRTDTPPLGGDPLTLHQGRPTEVVFKSLQTGDPAKWKRWLRPQVNLEAGAALGGMQVTMDGRAVDYSFPYAPNGSDRGDTAWAMCRPGEAHRLELPVGFKTTQGSPDYSVEALTMEYVAASRKWRQGNG